MFFQAKDPVHKTMRRLVKRLERAKIPYVVLGGMAVFAQGYRRPTNDVDILLTPEGLADFRRLFVPKYYETIPTRSRRFMDRISKVTIDILVSGMFPGSGKPAPVAFPDPAAVGLSIENVRFVNLPTLVQLKLAARRYQDFADVVHLIRVHNLDEPFAEGLHASVRGEFIECLEEKRREEEYEAREG